MEPNVVTEFLKDPNGKPSAMRAATLLMVSVGCAMLILSTLGFAQSDTTSDALWLVAIGVGGKWAQKISE